MTTEAERLWRRVERRGPDECWLWTGCVQTTGKSRGYGHIRVKRHGKWRTEFTHRLAYAIERGDIPESMMVLHSCDRPACCNPAHLRLGTHADNMADRTARDRVGPRAGEANPRHRLTYASVRAIRAAYARGGVTQDALAHEHGVSQVTVSRVVRGETWA